MTAAGVPIRVCRTCGHAVFPPRLLCPTCGGSDWREDVAESGVVEQATEAVFRTSGQRVAQRIASVRTGAGPVVIARLADDVGPGSAVALEVSDGAIIARHV